MTFVPPSALDESARVGVGLEKFLESLAKRGVIPASSLEIGGPFGAVSDFDRLDEEGSQRVFFFVHTQRRNLSRASFIQCGFAIKKRPALADSICTAGFTRPDESCNSS